MSDRQELSNLIGRYIGADIGYSGAQWRLTESITDAIIEAGWAKISEDFAGDDYDSYSKKEENDE